MRYMQAVNSSKKPTTKPEKKKEAPVKAGNPNYDYSNLANGRKIPTQGGMK